MTWKADPPLIPVAPFREKFLSLSARDLITPRSLARDLGWYCKSSPASLAKWQHERVPDGQRVRRVLGIARQSCRSGFYYRQRIHQDLAERLCEILNLDPWDVGM